MFLQIFEIRWLSFGDAIKAVIHNYHPLDVMLEEEAAKGDPAAIGLLAQLTKYKYIALLHLVGDILSVTNHLNRVFQYRDISFHTIKPQVC